VQAVVVTHDVPDNAIVAGNPAKLASLDRARIEGSVINGNGRIPFLDLVTPHVELEEELVSVFRRALKSAGFVGDRWSNSSKKSLHSFAKPNIAWA